MDPRTPVSENGWVRCSSKNGVGGVCERFPSIPVWFLSEGDVAKWMFVQRYETHETTMCIKGGCVTLGDCFQKPTCEIWPLRAKIREGGLRFLKDVLRFFRANAGFQRRNLLCQLARTWCECSIVEEPFLRYTITSLLACSDWVPFLDKLSAKQATPTTKGFPARRTINFSELSGKLPGHLWTGLRLPISFRSSVAIILRNFLVVFVTFQFHRT